MERRAVFPHEHRIELSRLPRLDERTLIVDLHHGQRYVILQLQLADQLLGILPLELHHARVEDVERLALAWHGLIRKARHLVGARTELVADVKIQIGVYSFIRQRGQKVAQPLHTDFIEVRVWAVDQDAVGV